MKELNSSEINMIAGGGVMPIALPPSLRGGCCPCPSPWWLNPFHPGPVIPSGGGQVSMG